jgi:type I restriction enzyme S subunit
MSKASAIASPDTIPLRYLADINPSVDFSELNDDAEVTFLPMDRVKSGYFIPNTDRLSKLASSYNSFANGDIVLAKVTPCFENGNIAITDNLVNGKRFGSSELFVIRPNEIAQRFLFYCLQSGLFKQEGEASMTGAGGLKRISSDVLRRHRVHAFPRQTQHSIATYLDRETARIDALVAEKERMLSLLEQKRAALISRAVTRGLNPNAPTKPSGLDWLGEIPKHWDVIRSKALFREIDDRTETGEEELLSLRMNVGLVPHRDVSEKELTSKDIVGYKRVQTGQLVINRMRASMGLIAIAQQDGLVSPDYAVFEVIQDIRMPYFLSLFNTGVVGALFRSSSKGLGNGSQGFLRLYSDNFLSIHFPVPPVAEQDAIITHIQAYQTRTATLESILRHSIVLLKERRSALITAAVTGNLQCADMSALSIRGDMSLRSKAASCRSTPNAP